MEVKEQKSENLNDSQLILFGFELNRSQTTLVLIFSLVGLFTTTIELSMNIFTLLNNLFLAIPGYLSQPNVYHKFHFYYNFAPVITRIIVFSIFFYLSLYGLKKILRHNNIKNKNKRKIIPQDRIVNWLGLKLSHGQSFLIFCLSLAGILLVIQFYIGSTTPMFKFLKALSYLPSGPNSFNLYGYSSNIGPFTICAIFMILCLYSLITCRRGKPTSPSNRFVKNYGLVIYIVSFIIFVFNLLRLLTHLYFYSDNVYQTRDFHRVILVAVICFILMISTYFLKESPGLNEDTNIKNKLRWMHIELTEKRAILLLSLAILGITIFSYSFLTTYFLISGFFINFNVLSFPELIIPGIFIILSFYAIDTVLKKNRLNYFINLIENSREITCKWFKFNLNRLNSVTFFSLSCGFIVFNVYILIQVNLSTRFMILYSIEVMPELIFIVSNAIITAIISCLLAINIYTIKRTHLSIKSG